MNFKAALIKVLPKASELQKRILTALFLAPDSKASSTQLARWLGIGHLVTIHNGFGRLGNSVFRESGRHPDGATVFQGWSVLAEGGERGEHGFEWILRPQVSSVIESLGIAESERDALGALTPGTSLLREGRRRMVQIEKRERNSVARSMCLDRFGERCAVCGLDFGKEYGADFANCIHVHHLIPLASNSGERNVDPIADLRPVCPNCHAMIHVGGNARSLGEVQRVLKRHRSRVG